MRNAHKVLIEKCEGNPPPWRPVIYNVEMDVKGIRYDLH
jgi:hypothetical protein